MSRYQPNKGCQGQLVNPHQNETRNVKLVQFCWPVTADIRAGFAYNDDEHKYESLTREGKHLNFGFVQPSTT